MASPQLSAPGSSEYSSNTLHVGDGTWDASRDDFLLPNIQGLNYATTRYNGMGNRFAGLPQYHTLILGHGIIAAITFLGVVPSAILIARFYYPNPRLALRLHIYLQIMTVILTTIVFVLAYFAVGPERTLTNPHHGIGLAIYVLVLLQALAGFLIHQIEKGKTRYYIPIKLMLHQWLGRGIALLALAQIPIGLALYGSPVYLFILYTLWTFGLLVAYFILTHQRHKRYAGVYDDRGSYITGTQTEITNEEREKRSRFGIGALTGALAGGAGLAALRSRRRSRGRQEAQTMDGAVSSRRSSHALSESYVDEEKFTDDGTTQQRNGRRNRLQRGAAGVAGAGAFAGIRSYFRRSRNAEQDSYVESSRPPLGGPVNQSTLHLNRMEEGLPVTEPNTQWQRVEDRERAQALAMSQPQAMPRRSEESEENFGNQSNQRRTDTGASGGFAAVAGLGGLGAYFQRRRERKEQARVDAERQRENEAQRIFGSSNQQAQYTDNSPRRPGGMPSESVVSGRTASANFNRQSIPPVPVNVNPAAQSRSHVSFATAAAQPPPDQIRPLPPNVSQDYGRVPEPISAAPPPIPIHQEVVRPPASASYGSPERRQRPRRHSNRSEHPEQPGVTSAAATRASEDLAPQRTGNSPNEPYVGETSGGQIESPPVAVKFKIHNDGRHVTLRRLNEEEAEREREARRRQKEARSARRGGDDNVSELSNVTNPQRFRRGDIPPRPAQFTVQQPAPQPMPQQTEEQHPLPSQQFSGPSPPSALAGGIGSSPGFGPATDMSSEYDSNRRRRRAERARAEQARLAARTGVWQSDGGRVEFT